MRALLIAAVVLVLGGTTALSLAAGVAIVLGSLAAVEPEPTRPTDAEQYRIACWWAEGEVFQLNGKPACKNRYSLRIVEIE